MKVLLFLLQNSRKNFLLALVTGLLAGASSSGIIALIHFIISTELTYFYGSLFGFITAWIGFGVFSAASTYFLSQLSQQTILDLRLTLTQQILNTPLQKIEAAESKIFLVLTEDINTLANSLERIPSVFAALATVLGCLLLMAFISPLLLGMLILILLLCFPFYIFPLKKMQNYLTLVRQEWNGIFKYFYGLNRGIKELLLSLPKQNAFLYKHLYPACHRQYQQAIRAKTLYTIASRWGDLFLLVGLGIIIFTLPHWHYISFAELSEFLLIFLFTLSPLTTILSFLNEFERMKVSLQKIEEVGLLIQSHSESHYDNAVKFFGKFKTLRLENVSYKYYEKNQEYPFYLSGINLEFKHPGVIFITGGNGSGKSTLVKILCGLYSPQQGRIYFNDVEIDEPHQIAYRQCFSAIFADFFLFEELLSFEELNYAEQAKQYLDRLELSQKVKIENGKFSTINLSQGQQKRLALLTAFLEDKEIYIFDEWASNQDPYFKKTFYYEIIGELKAKNKLVFAISHDESYYHIADRIIKLEDGKVVEDISNSA